VLESALRSTMFSMPSSSGLRRCVLQLRQDADNAALEVVTVTGEASEATPLSPAVPESLSLEM
ncbi:MAG TPA: ATP-dependent Clp protease ATP-binding subunit ClpX, partial [Candidatus Kapabacteria bacterium]|nr:ATP-dependent Clp protease ATP-binding subunit ClpX [Candidatus Kapabacteria bacterium]